MKKPVQSLQPVSGVSLQFGYLMHFLESLTRLQELYTGDTIKSQAYNLQINYLIAILPNEAERQAILTAMVEKKRSLKAMGLSETESSLASGMCVVSRLMEFLNNTLELSTEDITGSIGDIAAMEEKPEEMRVPEAPALSPAGGGDNGEGEVVQSPAA